MNLVTEEATYLKIPWVFETKTTEQALDNIAILEIIQIGDLF